MRLEFGIKLVFFVLILLKYDNSTPSVSSSNEISGIIECDGRDNIDFSNLNRCFGRGVSKDLAELPFKLISN